MVKAGEHSAQPLTVSAPRGCSSAWQDSSGDPTSLLTACGRRWCSHPSSWLRTGPRGGGGQDGARKRRAVLGLFLSNDVLDAGVQEHVLVLQKRKGYLESGF